MVGNPSIGTRAREALVASLIGVIALSATAVPASAKPSGSSPSSTTSVTMAPSSWFPGAYCTFDVTYRWSGVKGRDLKANVRVVDSTGATIASVSPSSGVSGSGTLEFIINFNGAVGDASRTILARGSLSAGGVEVSGSVATSQPFPSTCGGAYGVRTFSTIGLS